MPPRRSPQASEAGKRLRWVHRPKDRVRVNTKPTIPGTRPVADPEAKCVICDEFGADWYGRGGDAVHLRCFVRGVAPRSKGFDPEKNK